MLTRIIADLATGQTAAAPLTQAEQADVAERRQSVGARQTEEANAAIRIALDALDARSVRPLRAVLAAQAAGRTPDPADVARLAGLKTQADALRAALIT